MDVVPALEIGGTHVAGAMVDLAARRLVAGTRVRHQLDANGTAESILATILECAGLLGGVPDATWGIAIPGPFDFEAGIGRYEGVAKFGALRGVDVGRHLLDGLPAGSRVVFLNDADAFLVGEWAAGAAIGHERAVGITLGTGVGSGFLADGRIVTTGPDVPLDGEVHFLTIDGRPLEDTVSRRAIIAAYERLAARAGLASPLDVVDIAERARHGEAAALAAIDGPLRALGRALTPWLERFRATALVVGGSIARSWDLVEPPLRAEVPKGVVIVPARLPDDAGLIGAAINAAGTSLSGS